MANVYVLREELLGPEDEESLLEGTDAVTGEFGVDV